MFHLVGGYSKYGRLVKKYKEMYNHMDILKKALWAWVMGASFLMAPPKKFDEYSKRLEMGIQHTEKLLVCLREKIAGHGADWYIGGPGSLPSLTPGGVVPRFWVVVADGCRSVVSATQSHFYNVMKSAGGTAGLIVLEGVGHDGVLVSQCAVVMGDSGQTPITCCVTQVGGEEVRTRRGWKDFAEGVVENLADYVVVWDSIPDGREKLNLLSGV